MSQFPYPQEAQDNQEESDEEEEEEKEKEAPEILYIDPDNPTQSMRVEIAEYDKGTAETAPN